MMDFALINDLFRNTALFYAAAVMIVLVVLMPARILQKRHGYPSWLLVFGLIPYLGPLGLLWALAVSTPKQAAEG